MKFNMYKQATEYEERAKPFLSKNEDNYSLYYGVLQGIKAGRYENPMMVTVEDKGRTVGLLQMTPPHALNIIIIDGANIDSILTFVVSEMIKRDIHIPSVVGLKSVVYAFAAKWEVQNKCDTKLLMDQGLYRLDKVIRLHGNSSGTWRYARNEDAHLIEKWYHAFNNDVGLPIASSQMVQEKVKQFLQDQEVFLWEDNGKVVSMMKKARPTEHGVTVSFVFTPIEERKKGYARTMVAAGSAELLKTYDFCVLYTDMMNPTSNKIYQEIGYQKIADSVHLEFC
ncbi:GNAT family N-acetyltransferase [Paenisporosarcina sp. TG20]|uniref:GNAT family N-acetyltransferase n=1 Tax=Paenisporosarcina sp. TG20 TaxID=1211706 RepID=UPI0002DC28B6|nr:GNAT family N-acetyltransferase [Paenisporosarcina sp. TG20]